MPLTIESEPFQLRAATLREQRLSARDRARTLRIGLVNNMPDAAVAATERQFARLMEDASGEYDVRLVFCALKTVPREAAVRAAMAETYRDPRQLRLSSPDAIIVTGAEPNSVIISGEPFWDELTALLDWARHGVVSELYSCLAAHAAAHHRDGIARLPLERKFSGVFESEVVATHELTDGLSRAVLPQSRHNGFAESDLRAKGYRNLVYSPEAGADLFVRDSENLVVLLQGHPEYDRGALAREFRRDVLRFVRGERHSAPCAPANYFDAKALDLIRKTIACATPDNVETVAAALDPAALSTSNAEWRSTATLLMRNWLAAVARRKARRHSHLKAARQGANLSVRDRVHLEADFR